MGFHIFLILTNLVWDYTCSLEGKWMKHYISVLIDTEVPEFSKASSTVTTSLHWNDNLYFSQDCARNLCQDIIKFPQFQLVGQPVILVLFSDLGSWWLSLLFSLHLCVSNRSEEATNLQFPTSTTCHKVLYTSGKSSLREGNFKSPNLTQILHSLIYKWENHFTPDITTCELCKSTLNTNICLYDNVFSSALITNVHPKDAFFLWLRKARRGPDNSATSQEASPYPVVEVFVKAGWQCTVLTLRQMECMG